MPRLTRIYTRTGDDGTTALGFGERVRKDHLRVECYGTVDELNAHLGAAIAQGLPATVEEPLLRIQNDLFHLGAALCVSEEEKRSRPMPAVESRHVEWLEQLMDSWGEKLPALANFILPGGAAGSAHLHVARTVCRRAERLLVALAREEEISPQAIPYLNRLSDALFVLARAVNHLSGVPDRLWDSRA